MGHRGLLRRAAEEGRPAAGGGATNARDGRPLQGQVDGHRRQPVQRRRLAETAVQLRGPTAMCTTTMPAPFPVWPMISKGSLVRGGCVVRLGAEVTFNITADRL